MLVAEVNVKPAKGKARIVDRSDDQLVELAKSGDKSAFRELVEKYQQRAFFVAQRVLGSDSDAEDVVQESFVKAYLSLTSFKGESAFYSWLYRIVYNMAIDERRRKARKGGVAEDLDGLTESQMLEFSNSESPETAVGNRQELQRLQLALKQLSPEHREVLVMRELDGLAYEEIADTLGINRGTIMSRLFYARRNLFKLIRPEMELKLVHSKDY
jgi:RNA polymerase sigma-70 factor (ECF subfamily)